MRRRPPDPAPARPPWGGGAGGGLRRPTGVLAAPAPGAGSHGPACPSPGFGEGDGGGAPGPFWGGGPRAVTPLLRVWELGVSQPLAISFLLGEVCPALLGEVP